MGGQGEVKSSPDSWIGVVDGYRIGMYRGQQVVQARLRSDLSPDDPTVRAALAGFEGSTYVHDQPDGADVVLVRALETPDRTLWAVHILLFLLTLLTTHMAGALLVGVDPMDTAVLDVFGWGMPYPTGVDWRRLAEGAPFALSLVAILFAHEMGHYLAARAHRVRVTLPFFLPFPAYYSIVGTLGAFIRIKGPTVRRSILFDVGVAGPYASFLLSLPVLALGLSWSVTSPGPPHPWTPFAIGFFGEPLWIGASPIVQLLARLHFGDAVGQSTILLHPVAFAGWIGLFVTALNLLPVGQLDGGHVLYSLSPELQPWVGRVFLLVLLPLGLLWWGWWFWAVASLLVNRGRLRHPPVLQPGVAMDPVRRALGFGATLIFLLTFVPVPVSL